MLAKFVAALSTKSGVAVKNDISILSFGALEADRWSPDPA
jgi:hypothetical protein